MKLNLRLLIALLGVVFFPSLDSYAKDWISVNPNQVEKSNLRVISSNAQITAFHLDISGFYKDEVLTPRGKAFVISLPEGVKSLELGAPDIDHLSASIIIPNQGEVTYKITSSTFIDYPNIEVAPSKGNLIRTQLPSDVPYTYSSAYASNKFGPSPLIELSKPYILRDFRGQAIAVSPLQYNPVTKVLRVYTSMDFQIGTINPGKGINEIVGSNDLPKVNTEYKNIYASHFKNFNSLLYIPVEEEGNLLIICADAWVSDMTPLVDWKIKKGIPTQIVPVSTIGANAVSIQNYIQNYYNTNGLTYVLLVGDIAEIPSFTAFGGASDPSYGYILGNDSYAEVIVGRFSAEFQEDVNTQVQRTLDYERTPTSNNNWLQKGVVVASNQGPGDDGEMDWEHAQNMRTDLLNYTYTDISELYDGTHPGTTDASGDPSNLDLFNLFQSGIGAMTYTGHGSNTSCSTTGISVSDVNNMTNSNMLPFIWSVACVNGNFNTTGGPCFAEAFLRARNGNNPAGAVATFMSSINQSWNPPMAGQDEMVDLLVESYANNIKRTFGGISVNGCLLMNDQYAAAGFEMTDTWHCFGDPTLNLRTANPVTLTASHVNSIPVGSTSFIVNANIDSAFVSLTLNGSIVGTGLIIGGVAVINFNALTAPDSLFITITGYNLMPYEGFALIVPASGPYVTLLSSNTNDAASNNNGVVEYGETIALDVELHNLGSILSNGATIILSSVDPYVTINDNTETFAAISNGSSQLSLGAFSFTVSSGIPDQHIIAFTLTTTDLSGVIAISIINVVVSAPTLRLTNPIFIEGVGADGDGTIESGENAILTIRCENTGHADALLSNAFLSTLSSHISLVSSTISVGSILQQQYVDVQFLFSIAPGLANGTMYDLTIDLVDGAYNNQITINRVAGELVETFESANFTSYPWSLAGNMPWTINTTPYQGNYCALSGLINDSETSELEISFTNSMTDSIGFYYKVDSEESWDYLKITVDNSLVQEFSGNIPWTYSSFAIPAGAHVLKFSYEKDAIYSIGADCAWLDNIKFPNSSSITAIKSITANESFAYWPNPASDFINIEPKAGLNSIQVFDNVGRLVFTQRILDNAISNLVIVPCGEWQNGVYSIVAQSKNGLSTSKFIKIK
jgi:hypothetical protein